MKAIFCSLILIISGCSALGLPVPQTFNQKLAVAYGGVTTVITTDQTLLAAGTITVADAKNVESQADNVKDALDIARKVYATDQTTGGNKLASAVTALGALQDYLATKGK